MRPRFPFWRVVVWGLVLAALAGCSYLRRAPGGGVKVILLPQADGSSSSVVVTSSAGVQTLSTPYQSVDARAGDRQAPVVRQNDPAEINRQFGTLFKQAPARPLRYVLYFGSGTTELTAESRITLFDAVLDALNRSGAEILITGHTDTEGSERLNDRLAERRARYVETLFVERGFTVTRIRAAGRGEREPAVPTRRGVDEPLNRRVEIVVR